MGVVIGVVLGGTAGGLIAAFQLSHWLLHALQMIFALVGLYGYWKYTSPDPSASEQDQQLSARKLVRVCQVSSVFAIPLAPFMQRSAPEALSMLFSLLVGLVGIVGFYAGFIYTARLATRIPDETLARSFRTLMWAFTIFGALVLVIAIVAAILQRGVQGSGSSGWAAFAGCFGGIGFLVLIVFAIINVLRLRRALLKAAAFAESTWAAAPTPHVG